MRLCGCFLLFLCRRSYWQYLWQVSVARGVGPGEVGGWLVQLHAKNSGTIFFTRKGNMTCVYYKFFKNRAPVRSV